jgi:hypothetical protein
MRQTNNVENKDEELTLFHQQKCLTDEWPQSQTFFVLREDGGKLVRSLIQMRIHSLCDATA